MTSQFGCLELLITQTFLSGPVKFEITRVDCIWFLSSDAEFALLSDYFLIMDVLNDLEKNPIFP